jgi:hypothetical protein
MSSTSSTGRWSVTESLTKSKLAQVFCGGACNILDGEGHLRRNAERDKINDWLTEKGLFLFDPQIHPDTHGEDYNYSKHHPIEIAARRAAQVRLYEVSPRTFGGITSLEVAMDSFRWREPMVIYFSDGNAGRDEIPAHSDTGHPLFVPYGIHHDSAMRAHYQEFLKNGNHMRKYLVRFAQEMDTLTVIYGERPHESDIVITPYRMHAVDLFRAMVTAASGQRVFVNFTGGKEARDDEGNPLFLLPATPPPMEMKSLLDQYVDEGCQLRRMMAKLLVVTVYLRIVYTQGAAIFALEELLRIKKVLK